MNKKKLEIFLNFLAAALFFMNGILNQSALFLITAFLFTGCGIFNVLRYYDKK